MANRAVFVLAGPEGHTRHRSSFGAVGLDLDLLAGPETVLPFLRAHLGLAPEEAASAAVSPGPALEPGDEEFDDPDPLVAVVTIGPERCAPGQDLADIEDHPVEEGPALLDRLRGAPDHGSHRLRADAGIHVDPERRRVGWWLNTARAHARTLAARRPGWTVEFWEDRWAEHQRACGGRFAPPAPDHAAALAGVREQGLERWAGPRGARAGLVAVYPHIPVGNGFAPGVTADQAAAARAAIEAAYREAVRA